MNKLLRAIPLCIFSAFCFLVVNAVVAGEPPGYVDYSKDAQLVPITADNPDKKIVDAKMDAMRTASGQTMPEFYGAWQIQGVATKILFPDYRFYTVCWEEVDTNPQMPVIGKALNLHETFGIGPDGKMWEFGGGDFKEFGQFLAQTRTRIQSQADAGLVWKALIEIHRNGGRPDDKCERASATQWTLGIKTFDGYANPKTSNADRSSVTEWFTGRETIHSLPGIVPKITTTIYYIVTTEADGTCLTWERHDSPLLVNADTSARIKNTFHVPTKCFMDCNPGEISASIEHKSMESIKLKVGSNMATGAEADLYVYPAGESRPAEPSKRIINTEMEYGLAGLCVNTDRDGMPKPGKKYVVEVDFAIFETDIPFNPPAWDPHSKNYKVLWTRTFSQTVTAR
jgi:hypothetical protein